MVPLRSDRVSRAPPYSRMRKSLRLRGYHPLWPAFPNRSAYPSHTTGLFHVRSPLLAESLLMSFPPGTEMFQFPGFASPTYVFSERYPKGVGCPIRISTDQSLLAAPHGFSQRATSFIASWCQGIHRMPFSYSISNASRQSSHRHQSSVIRPQTGRNMRTSDQAPSLVFYSAQFTTPLTTITATSGTTLGHTRMPPRSLPVRQITHRSDGPPPHGPKPRRHCAGSQDHNRVVLRAQGAPEPDSQHKRTTPHPPTGRYGKRPCHPTPRSRGQDQQSPIEDTIL